MHANVCAHCQHQYLSESSMLTNSHGLATFAAALYVLPLLVHVHLAVHVSGQAVYHTKDFLVLYCFALTSCWCRPPRRFFREWLTETFPVGSLPLAGGPPTEGTAPLVPSPVSAGMHAAVSSLTLLASRTGGLSK